MSIRWRIGIAALQLIALLTFVAIEFGTLFVPEPWFFAGLIAVVINPTLLEPYYHKPQDVVVNFVLVLTLYLTTTHTDPFGFYWSVFLLGLMILAIVALISMLLGSKRGDSDGSHWLANAGLRIIDFASSKKTYSVVVALSSLELYHTDTQTLLRVLAMWTTILLVGSINWELLFTIAASKRNISFPERLIGPSILQVSAPRLPQIGAKLNVWARGRSVDGILMKRIARKGSIWGEVFIENRKDAERLLSCHTLELEVGDPLTAPVVGAVSDGSTDSILHFWPNRALQIGSCVTTRGCDKSIIYQISAARVQHASTIGGGQLVVSATANQVGFYSPEELRLRRYQWVADVGAPVLTRTTLADGTRALAEDELQLGRVIGTDVPVVLDTDSLSQGHMAILGMTKMGKSTLAERLAKKLSLKRFVLVLDLTGEYVSKKKLARMEKGIDVNSPGLYIYEPDVGKVPAEAALACIDRLVDTALVEYKSGDPFPRTIIIDEAHQFVPEPAGLGFNTPGREQSIKIGLQMMQIRKYGISVILISQRTAVVAKSALSQCENIVAFKSVDQTGLDYLEAVSGMEIRNILPNLKQGEALAFGPAVSSDVAVAINMDRD